MIKEAILFAVLLVLAFAGWTVYQNLPGEPQPLVKEGNSETFEIITSSSAPVFYENMRFPDEKISFFISQACTETKKRLMKEAFKVLENKTQTLDFYEKKNQDAEIIIGCSEEVIEQGGDMVVAGEGGPTKVINTGLFNVILEGRIFLYSDKECDLPIVEIHELLHVLGFNHSTDEKNIMYPVSSCDQKISEDIIETLTNNYAHETLSDLTITQINATKKGRYLDFAIVVKNVGLKSASGIKLDVLSENKSFDSYDLGALKIGASRLLNVEN